MPFAGVKLQIEVSIPNWFNQRLGNTYAHFFNVPSFNPKLVQLENDPWHCSTRKYFMFQSQTGSIRGLNGILSCFRNLHVSIPNWFNQRLAKVSGYIIKNMFQSQTGSIRGRAHFSGTRLFNESFNPKLVQLEVMQKMCIGNLI